MVKDIEDIRAVKIKGYLHKCDYSASGNYMIEYPHDFLEQGLESCMRKWQRKNSQCGMEFTTTILHGKTKSEYYCHSSNRNGKNGGRFMVDWKS